jgi:hypothetical protein
MTDSSATSFGPPDEVLTPDPVIDVYKKDVDRTLIRAQLSRSVDDRVRTMIARGLNFTLTTTVGALDLFWGGRRRRILRAARSAR